MWLLRKQTFLQIAIALVVFGLTIATIAVPWYNRIVDDWLELIRVLQFGATCLLLFGILKAHPQHKDKFMLFWMVVTALCILILIYAGLTFFLRGSYGWVLLPWVSAVIVTLLLNIIYNHYVALTVGAEETITEVLQTKHPLSNDLQSPLNVTIIS